MEDMKQKHYGSRMSKCAVTDPHWKENQDKALDCFLEIICSTSMLYHTHSDMFIFNQELTILNFC